MSKGSLVGLLLAAGGGFVAYQYGLFCSFGFGPSCAPPATPPAPPGTTPPPPGTTTTPPPTTPAPTTTPSTPAPGSTSFSLVGPVAPDINNSLKGQVSISGSTMTVNCIPPGTIYSTAGVDITGDLAGKGVDTSALCAAMQNAMQAQTAAAGTKASPADAATLASMKAMLAGMQAALPGNPGLQPSILQLQQQIAIVSKAAGLSGYMGMGARRKPGLYAMPGARRINYVRKARLA